MYEAYYGFEEKPFTLSPDPKYLFLSATHREVLGHLIYGIEQGEGFMAISGEVGTGKTTLCRTLLDRLGTSCEIAFLFNPMLSPTDLIKAINAEFDLSTYGDSRPELIDVLNTFLLEKNADGRRVLVIIDEAQNLPSETLEQLRLLSNLESRTAKLLQIVLIGQPELDEKLEARDLRQLRQRITVWWRLGPLRSNETREYVRHRLRIASGADRPIFTDAALVQVHRLAGGVPRLVNVICDRALLAGYGEQSGQIQPGTIRTVARELRLAGRSGPRPWLWLGLAAGAGAAGLALAVGLGWIGSPARGPAPPPVAAAAPPEPSLARRPPQAPFAEPPDLQILPGSPAAPEPTAVREAPVEPEPGPPALSDDVLDSLLSLEPPEVTHGLALAALFDAWRVEADAAPALGFPQLLAGLEAQGLRVLRVASPELLTDLDVPGIARLPGSDGELRSLVVRHVRGDEAQLAGLVQHQLVRVPMHELVARATDSGYAVWRDFEGLPPVLREGRAGPGVAFLQRALTRLGHYQEQTHGSFDDFTRQGVMSFQAEAGLPVDGECGPRTQIRIYHALPEYRMPTLALPTGTDTAGTNTARIP